MRHLGCEWSSALVRVGDKNVQVTLTAEQGKEAYFYAPFAHNQQVTTSEIDVLATGNGAAEMLVEPGWKPDRQPAREVNRILILIARR
jgi:hypothetical protein